MLRGLKTFNPAEVEEKVLEFWKKNQIFEKSLKQRKSARGRTFKFYEGPPYANGRPGIHHVLARVFKDIILRYKAMRGYYVPRKAGWDTHGLPVEIEAERQLGIKSKKEIEKFGIALFNEKAKEAVWKYKDEWEKITERIGYWLDLKNAYITYENSYIESCWWIFKRIANRGYLTKSYKIVPYCSRCETPLASHELGMPDVYKKVSDPSVYVKLKLKRPSFALRATEGKQVKIPEFLLVWTTTPWTLPSNMAVAVDPKLTYTKFLVTRENGKKAANGQASTRLGEAGEPRSNVEREFVWSYNPPPESEGAKVEVAEKQSGQKLVGLEYEPLYRVKSDKRHATWYKILPADFILTEEGTGLVHIAPAFGEEDLNLIKSQSKDFDWRTVPVTVDDTGKVRAGFPGAGKFIKSADKDIIADLTKRELMYRSGVTEHEYPFCWRCGTPLIYFARLSWFFEVSRLRQELVKANQTINWIPSHIKDGRFGEWIREAKDWAISRNRYWGTPLPIWECGKCEEMFVAGSLADLNERDIAKNNFFMIRHGETDSFLTDTIAAGPEKGRHISELTARGIKQIQATAVALQKKNIDVIYTSPYKRTRDTAKIIAKKIGARVIVDKRLGELDCGVFNWRADAAYHKFFTDRLERFVKAPPGGETLTDLRKRVFEFLNEINKKYSGKNIVIVGHGDPLWMMEAAAQGIKAEDTFKLSYLKTGAFKELQFKNMPRNSAGEIDMHRPFVDDVHLRCRACGHKMKRVKDVADVWFDSGAMPLASYHYPFKQNYQLPTINYKLPEGYPADYISEGIDQTRGWFYTMLAVSTLLGLKAPYKNVICLGLILDKNGVKMSKSKGNIVDPWEMMGKYGVDAIRWYLFTVNPPGEPKQFDEAEVGKTMRRIFMILYNSFIFLETYGKKSKNAKEFQALPGSKNILDAWIMARRHETVGKASKFLERYDVGNAAKAVESLLDDLSRWYIRRSRRRFQKPVSAKDLADASKTLEYILFDMARLLAPFAPFFAEALYQSLRQATSDKRQVSESVHLLDWPAMAEKIDKKLLLEMQWVREVATKALAKRAEAGIKVRQPLQSVSVMRPATSDMAEKELLEILKDEINVKEVLLDKNLKDEIMLDTKITPELKEEGIMRDLVRAVQELRQNAGYTQKDTIELFVDAGELEQVITRHEASLKKEVGAKTISFKKSDKFDAEIMTKLDGQELYLAVRKTRN